MSRGEGEAAARGIGVARGGAGPGRRGPTGGALALWTLGIASVGVAGYAIVGYTMRPLGSLVHPAMRVTFNAHRLAILTHIFASSLALLLGPVQFIGGVRRRWPGVHRWMGRVYLGGGVPIGGLAGLYMAAHAYGGAVSHAGFGLPALAWLHTGARAYERARARDLAAHRAWMIRNFSLTLAAVTFRIGLGLGFVSGLEFAVFYPPLTWLCWIPNLIVAEGIVRGTRMPRRAGGGGVIGSAPIKNTNDG